MKATSVPDGNLKMLSGESLVLVSRATVCMDCRLPA